MLGLSRHVNSSPSTICKCIATDMTPPAPAIDSITQDCHDHTDAAVLNVQAIADKCQISNL